MYFVSSFNIATERIYAGFAREENADIHGKKAKFGKSVVSRR